MSMLSVELSVEFQSSGGASSILDLLTPLHFDAVPETSTSDASSQPHRHHASVVSSASLGKWKI